MRYLLPALVCLLFVLGLATVAPAQTWQPSILETGVPKPQGPTVPTLNGLQQQQQDHIRAQNQASQEQDQQLARYRQQGQQDIEDAQRDYASREAIRRQAYAANKQLYETGFLQLKGMLEGNIRYDLKRAVFLTENMFMNGQYDYGQFKRDIANLVQLGRGLAADSAHPNPAARFLALHQLMTDTVRVRFAGKVVMAHRPFTYDFEDFLGHEDHTKQFVTKLLATNTGQCHSMPLLYKLVADELGVKTYISMAPNHSYIQVKDNHGLLHSYETTNGHFTTFSYYMSTGYVKAPALKQRTFLDTLTRNEMLACRLFDLAAGYQFRHGCDAFAEKCIVLGLHYYPHSAQGRMMACNAALTTFVKAWVAAGKPPKEQAPQLPALKPLWVEVEKWRRAIDALGYEDMPPEKYALWLKQMDAQKNKASNLSAARQFEQTAK
jgi:hypothetical protein